jgi:ankyrin repeat protein
MHLAARNGHLRLINFLLERDADVRVLNDVGRTPYQLAMEKGHQKMADLLQDYERKEHNA